MTDLNDPMFYARREQQERVLADRAHDPQIRTIHLELADRYRALVESLADGARPRLGARLAG